MPALVAPCRFVFSPPTRRREASPLGICLNGTNLDDLPRDIHVHPRCARCKDSCRCDFVFELMECCRLAVTPGSADTMTKTALFSPDASQASNASTQSISSPESTTQPLSKLGSFTWAPSYGSQAARRTVIPRAGHHYGFGEAEVKRSGTDLLCVKRFAVPAARSIGRSAHLIGRATAPRTTEVLDAGRGERKRVRRAAWRAGSSVHSSVFLKPTKPPQRWRCDKASGRRTRTRGCAAQRKPTERAAERMPGRAVAGPSSKGAACVG